MNRKKYTRLWIIFGVSATLIYHYFFFSSVFKKDGKIFQHNIKKTALMNLETLIGEIDTYKKMNGFYPESLAYFKNPDKPMLNPYDILNVVNHKPGIFYQYGVLNEGRNYYLFSVGFDLLPFTNDDIFVDPTKLNNSNTGYISRIIQTVLPHRVEL